MNWLTALLAIAGTGLGGTLVALFKVRPENRLTQADVMIAIQDATAEGVATVRDQATYAVKQARSAASYAQEQAAYAQRMAAEARRDADAAKAELAQVRAELLQVRQEMAALRAQASAERTALLQESARRDAEAQATIGSLQSEVHALLSSAAAREGRGRGRPSAA